MRKRRRLFDDLGVEYEWHNIGPPVYYPNQNIRRMLDLADLKENDIFYDLGSGFGQNIVIALTEFNAKKAVGFELNKERLWVSRDRLKKGGLRRFGKIIEDDFDEALTEKHLRQATIIYYGLETDAETIEKIENTWKKLKPGRRLVYRHKSLFPEIMPDKVAFPFYLSVTQLTPEGRVQFRRPRTEEEWLTEIVLQPKEIVHRDKPTLTQLWKEFEHNYDVDGTSELIEGKDGLKERLKRAVSRTRFSASVKSTATTSI